MNLEQFQYTVAGIKAVQIYSNIKMTKRYFRGFRDTSTNQLYHIVIYPHKLVKTEPLINSLKAEKALNHDMLSKILSIYEQTPLIKAGEKQQQETVIATLLQDCPEDNYIFFFDFILQVGNLSERLAKDFIFRIIHFVRYMEQNGFQSRFNSNDILIQKRTGNIKFDNYGDSRHFIIKQDILSDVWQLGAFLFTLLKGMPPYNRKSQSDTHYNCLNKGNFQKFWGLILEKPVKNPSAEATAFMNTCFQKDKTLSDMINHPWLQNYVPLTQNQRIVQIQNILSEKLSKLQAREAQQRIRKQKMMQAARQRSFLIKNRGTHSELIQTFLDNLLLEQQRNRPIIKQNMKQQQAEKIKVKIAELLTVLSLNQDKQVKIYDIRDNKNSITFKITTQLSDYININAEVQLQIEKNEDNVRFVCKKIDAPFFQSIWVNNYIKQIYMEI